MKGKFETIPWRLDPQKGLLSLGGIFFLGLVLSRWMGWYEQQVRIEGPIAQKVADNKRLVSLVPDLNIDEAYLLAQRMLTEQGASRAEVVTEFRGARDHYEIQHRNSLDLVTNDQDREAIATVPYDRANAFFKSVESNIISKFDSGENLVSHMRDEVDPLYKLYRDAIDGILQHAESRMLQAEGEGTNLMLRWAGMRAIFDSGLLAVCLIIIWLIYRGMQEVYLQKGRLELVTDMSSSAILLTDRSSKIQWVNHGFEKLFGYTLQECLGQRLEDFLKNDNNDPYMAARLNDAFRNGDSCRVEMVGRSRAGTDHILDIEIQPTLDIHERISGFVSVQTDRSEAVRLRQRLSSVFRSIAEGIVLQGPDGKIFDCNIAAERILGLTRNQLLGRDSLDPRWLTIREDGSIWPGESHPAMESLRTGNAIRDAIMGVQLPDGALRWISINSHPVQNAKGETEFVIASFSDITSLREHIQRLNLAIGGAGLNTWDWQIATDRIVVHSPRSSNDDEPVKTFTKSEWRARIHPDDLRLATKLWEDHVAGRSVDYRSEHRIETKAGTWTWVLEAGKTVEKNSTGVPIRMSGIQLDISESKAMESLVRDSERRQRQVLDANLDAVISIDQLGVITDWNLQAQACFGWSRAEAIGKPMVELIIPTEFRAPYLEGMKKFHETGTAMVAGKRMEVVGLRKDGSHIPIEISILCLRFEEVVTFTAFLRDISAFKAIESRLAQSPISATTESLAAGVAHEINTPVQYASDSCHFLRDGMRDLLNLLEQYRILKQHAAEGKTDIPRAKLIEKVEEELDIDYLFDQMPKAIDRTLEGLGKIGEIVRSVTTYSQQDGSGEILADVNQALQSALLAAKHDLKSFIEVKTDLGKIPEVLCYPGELSQAFTKIIARGAQAIEDRVRGTSKRGQIRISTKTVGERIQIAIHDNGLAMSERACTHVFDPPTTPPEPLPSGVSHVAGSPTNSLEKTNLKPLDLSTVKDVVVKQHNGTIKVDSKLTNGTIFTIQLPIRRV